MCDPLTAVAVGSTIGGTLAQNRANRSAGRAMNRASDTERKRQEGYRGEAEASLADTLAKFERPAQDAGLVDIKASRGGAAMDAIGDAMPYAPTSGSAPRVVAAEAAKGMNKALMEGKADARHMADLNAWSEQGFGNALDLNSGRTALNMLGNFSAGSAGVLPYEHQAAQRKSISPIADMLKGIGQIASFASMTGVPGSGAPGQLGHGFTGSNGMVAGRV